MFRVHLSTDVHTSEVCLARRRPCAVMLPCAPQRTSSAGQHRSRKRFETQRNAVFKLAHVAVCRDAADIPSVQLLRVVMPAAEECFAWAAAGGRGRRRLVHQPMMPLHDAFPVRDCSKRHAKISAQAALTKQISPGAIVSSIGEVTAQAASAAPPPWPPLAIDSGSSQKCLWTATCERGQMTLLGNHRGEESEDRGWYEYSYPDERETETRLGALTCPRRRARPRSSTR